MRSNTTTTETAPGITFTFPGQGSYSYPILRELYTSFPSTLPCFQQAHDIGRELLNGDFLSLVAAKSEHEHDNWLRACPDLDQIGIYLTEVLIARLLIESGVKPALLVGHSFGELAALAISGAFSIETGLRIVCHRVAALQTMARPGTMAAISCDLEHAEKYLKDLGSNSIEVSVINQPRQTVLSGEPSELEDLRAILNRHGVTLTFLKSRYPYHSSFLERAVAPYRTALEAYSFRPATIPVYLCMDGVLYSPGCDLAQGLSSQFVRSLDFKSVVRTLYDSGYRTFVECGSGNIVTRLIGQNLMENAREIEALTTTPEGSLQQGLRKLWDGGFGKEATPAETVDVGGTKQELFENMSQVVRDMSRLVENTSRLIAQVCGDLEIRRDGDAATRGQGDAEIRRDGDAATRGQGDAAKGISSNGSSQPSLRLQERQAETPTSTIAASKNRLTAGEIADKLSATPGRSHEQHKVRPREECKETPIAIVSMGCVLPGAYDPEQYWSNLLNGVSGISNLADTEPSDALDFVAGNDGAQIKIIPDKTYTLLHGGIVNVPYRAELLSPAYDKLQFDSLTKGQKLLALAVGQSLHRLRVRADWSAKKVQVILGATADGSKEYDDALFLESLETLIGTLDEPEHLRHVFGDTLEEVSGCKNGDAKRLTQHKIYAEVIERLLGAGIPTYVVDTACSSSLYSIYLGMRALQDHDSDLVVSGGVFAPGPANNTLFAQFRGLTPRESRPFDVSADGVVFGDGAGVTILKRLPDAIADGDHILAVIRGVGLSSDGRSPSINVPQAMGQGLAIRSAYEHSGIDMDTVQYVEAHATATLVGDAVEFNALKSVMQRDPTSPLVELGSVKALVGHTGWAAGMASVIKMCKGFEARVIPRQFNYVEPSPEIDLAHSHFRISTAAQAWPDNGAYPRRAAINGFGFGGTNAHLILEDFDQTYHQDLCSHLNLKEKMPTLLAVVGLGSLFPDADGLVGDNPSSGLRFKRESLRLPAKKMLLPDVTEHMDASQYLAALAAERTFATMPGDWTRFKSATGVVLGIESKTERGARANERIFVDRLRRRLSETNGNGKLSATDANRILDKLVERIRTRNIPSGPYTLPGLMPNVTAGRIANMFDLHGPNLVVDMGGNSLLQSLFVARQLLTHRDCKIVLAGGINARNGSDAGDAETAFLLALTTPETAAREGLTVLATMNLLEPNEAKHVGQELSEIDPGLDYRGARSAPEMLRAIDLTRRQTTSCGIGIWEGSLAGSRVVFAHPSLAGKTSASEPSQPQADSQSSYAYIQGTPIWYYTPQLTPTKVDGEPRILKDRKILFLTDQPDLWLTLERSGALQAFEYQVVCPLGSQLEKSVPVDLMSDESIRNSLSGLASLEFDVVIAIKTLAGRTKEAMLLNNSSSQFNWIDSLFAICRHSYERIQTEKIPVVALCLNAYSHGQLDPFTGLASGFMKSLSRELDGPVCRIINTDEVNLYRALRQVEIELGQARSEVEVCYQEGLRSTFALAPVENLAKDDQPFLDSDSVVIATGGARGVTAVLAEELLRRFGCRVIALGRTDPDSAPENVRSMDEESFKRYEQEFYREALARNKARKITDLKREYRAYRAANEVGQVTKQLGAISEKFEYHSVDITSESAIDEVVEATYRKYGRVDLILHGAGVQVSKALTKKSVNDFRRIIATKLDGLGHLYRACEKYRNGRRIHFHILTSAFSYMGNDGQPDYGAANEAMNRIAACLDSPEQGTHWSAMAWLGWAGIGMTRDSEFAALAASRRLRGVTKEEGQEIFAAIMKGTPTTPINVLLADGEIDYYKVAIQSSTPAALPTVSVAKKTRKDFQVTEREISLTNAPYLVNHLVDGVPTLPGAFVIAVFAEAAHQLRPDLRIISFEKASFRRFVKVFESRKTRIRVEAQIKSEDDREAVVHVRILSDFVHSSGVVLQKDVLQHEILVRMSPTLAPIPRCFEMNGVDGRPSPDPYVMTGSPVSLSGPFNAMKNLVIGGDHRRADFKLADLNGSGAKYQPMLSRIVLMDSLWRFGVIQLGSDNSLPVFVPESCDVMKVFFDFADFDISKVVGTLTFTGTNPRPDGDLLHMGPVAAIDDDGNTLLLVERGVCRRFGEVRNGHAL